MRRQGRAFHGSLAGLVLGALAAAQGQRLNEPFALPDSDVLGFALDARGQNAVFAADRDVDNVFELYGGPTDFHNPPRELSAVPVPGGGVVEFAISPDGAWAVYRADQAVDESLELFAVPIDGSAAPVRLNPAQASDRDVAAFRISADSTRVVFLSNQRGLNSNELYAVPIDGSAPATLLHPLGGTRDTLEFALAPDGSRVVERADPNGVVELFSVPSDGSAAPVRLNGNLAQFATVASFQVSADSQRVVYFSDQSRAGVFDLFGGPLDGSAPAKRLNPRLPLSGDVSDYAITPDARRVVYLADADADSIFELFVTDFTGDHAGKLDPGLAPGGSTLDFLVSPDGRFVAFRAQALAPTQNDLFCAPLRPGPWPDGRRPVARVSGPLIPNGDVRLYAFARERIVYLADQDVDSRIEVYSAPVSGGVPARKLSGALTATGASLLRISNDGRTAVYRAERQVGVAELFAVPADGSAAPKRLNAALVTNGAVLPDFTLRGQRAFYRADQEIDGMLELFSSFLVRPNLPR
ncbi:MAG: hypothetical protein EXS08_14390 [Planctomycetes bacterium]|nr:hypothetical protein [Planctomycetota bacterium]